MSTGLDKINETLGLSTATTTDTSPATMIGALTSALQQYAASPADTTLGQAAVTAAQKLAANLNTASATVQSVRADADNGIAAAVTTINSLLKQFGEANNAVITATSAGVDASDALDQRNEVLSELSEQIGITTATTGNGGLAIYTDGGATLFQGSGAQRHVFAEQHLCPGPQRQCRHGGRRPGDGLRRRHGDKKRQDRRAHAMRDTTAVAYGNQLDQIANGLISDFSEVGPDGRKCADRGRPVHGLRFDDPAHLHHRAGFGDHGRDLRRPQPGRQRNVAARRRHRSFGQQRLHGQYDGRRELLDASHRTDRHARHVPELRPDIRGRRLGHAVGLRRFIRELVRDTRQDASTTSTNKAAVVTQTTTNLSSATGVNLDEQLSKMLDLEHSYQASAELMTTVKSMLDSLLSAVN